MADTCTHLGMVRDVSPGSNGCEDCMKTGASWLHLRLCMSCGHVGCCDSSPNQHASAHARGGDPLVQSFEPGEDWWWCYVDELAFAVDGGSSFSHS